MEWFKTMSRRLKFFCFKTNYAERNNKRNILKEPDIDWY